MKRQAMEEAKLRIQQMEEDAGFKVDKKEIPPPEINKEELDNDHHDERNVVYIDKNELKDNPQNILNIENSVVYITSSSRAGSPSPSHQDNQEEEHHGHRHPLKLPPLPQLPSLATQSLKSQDDQVN